MIGLVFTLVFSLQSAAKTRDLVIGKDHVIDILLLTLKEEGRTYQKAYFEDIGPLGSQLGYTANTFFNVVRKPISGMYSPRVLAVGSWPGDWQDRQKRFAELLVLAPDIRSRRLDIWSTFNMVNFEVKQDINIRFDPEQIYVFGAYWTGDTNFATELKLAIEKAGGSAELSADSVTSMFGYQRSPDVTLISRWSSQKAFDSFYKSFKAKLNATVEYSSEFYLEVD